MNKWVLTSLRSLCLLGASAVLLLTIGCSNGSAACRSVNGNYSRYALPDLTTGLEPPPPVPAGIVASATFDGGTTAARFVDYLKDHLIPKLRPGQVVVLDNLAAHNDKRVDQLVEAAGCTVIRLPPYSPDYNPIEKAISKVKTTLRKIGERTVSGLYNGIATALATITSKDASAFASSCGYATLW